jgi:glycosyltransferase involved in cell wall biosynthesis
MKTLVVTPTLGESAWLADTVASVAAQRSACIHVLVAPAPAVAALAARFPHTTVAPESGEGMYAAINAGLRAARDWDAFTYINDDDRLLPRFSAVVDTAARHDNEALVVYGGVQLIDARGRRLGAIPISPRPAFNRSLYAQRIEPVYQHGTLFTRKAVEQLGGFDESFRFCGDSELLARACIKGVPFARAPRGEVAAFRLRAGQLTKNRAALTAERIRVDEKLGLLVSPLTEIHHRARRAFRIANAAIYIERILRHGFVSFDELLTRQS